jgi:hypothetical protein
MKVKFNNLMSRVKSYNWGKAQMLAKDVLRFGACSVATAAFTYTFSVIEQQKMLEYKNAVKEADIELYNRINEEIKSNNKGNTLHNWKRIYNQMEDSISISSAQRAYFEGSQLVNDSVKMIK